MKSIDLSIRVSLKKGSPLESSPALVDELGGYKKLGLSHAVLDFRRDTLGEMVEVLDRVARDVRPAVDRA